MQNKINWKSFKKYHHYREEEKLLAKQIMQYEYKNTNEENIINTTEQVAQVESGMKKIKLDLQKQNDLLVQIVQQQKSIYREQQNFLIEQKKYYNELDYCSTMLTLLTVTNLILTHI